MFKIGDFSKLGQVSVRMLRHYDKLGLLEPSEVDRWTGYRYYTIDQLARLNRIVALNGLGLTLQQIGDLLEDDDSVSPERLRGMLAMRRAAIEQELMEKQMQFAGVEARLRQIEQEGEPSPYEVVVKLVEPQPVASIRQFLPNIFEMDYYCEVLYKRLHAHVAVHKLEVTGPELTLYHTEEYRETDVEVETALPVTQEALSSRAATADEAILFHELPGAELAASVIYEGSYAEIQPAVLALLAWIGSHNHTIAGPLRELHLSGPAHVDGELQEPAVLELQVPVRQVDLPRPW